jgi:hypothetical protein
MSNKEQEAINVLNDQSNQEEDLDENYDHEEYDDIETSN